MGGGVVFCEQGGQRQHDLFGDIDGNRLPNRPYCSDDLSSGLKIRSLLDAITRPYLQINPPHLRVWMIFDIDRAGGVLAYDDAGLPFPTWGAVNSENGHAHLVYGLSAPVLVDSPDMRQAPMRYLCAIEAAYSELLQADMGFSGLITKNPANSKWGVFRHPSHVPFYDLHELEELLPYGFNLRKFAPKRKRAEEVGLGRNVTLFNVLRHWAYKAVREYRGAQRNYVLWSAEAYGKALEYNGDFNYPLHERECYHIAKSVSKWTWRKDADALATFTARQAHKGAKGGLANSSEMQALKGKASALARWGDNEDKQGSARIMAARGMTQRAIAQELGVSDRTIRNWLK